MTRRRKDPLRALTDDERRHLTRLRRSSAAPAVHVARAVMLLAVADGSDYQTAARAAGRKSGDAVSHLVARFNREGLAALDPRHGGGRAPTYDAGGPRPHPARGRPHPDPGSRRHRHLVAHDPAARPPGRPRRAAERLHLHHLAGAPRGRVHVPADPHLVPDRVRRPPPQGRGRDRHRPRRRSQKKLIEDAYTLGRVARPGGLVRGRGRPVPGRPAPRARRGGRRGTRPASRTSTSATARPRC